MTGEIVMAVRNENRDATKTLVWGVLFILGASWFWYYLVGNPLDELALMRRGQTAPGFIVNASEHVEEGARGEARWLHSVVYKYQLPDGRVFTQQTRRNSGRLKDEFHDMREPHPIEVEYLPDDPAVSRIKGSGSTDFFDWLWRKLGLSFALLALFLSPGVVLFRNGCLEIMRVRALKPK